MTITTHLTRIVCGAAAAGVLMLGGAGIAQAQEQTPRPAPPSAPQAPETAPPQVSAAPGAPASPRRATTAPYPGPQVRAVPEGAPETGGGPADPALGTVAALVGGGALALAAGAGAVTVAVRRRT
jgi:hypothetical protein